MNFNKTLRIFTHKTSLIMNITHFIFIKSSQSFTPKPDCGGSGSYPAITI